ncbi:MAG: LPS assembly protein LptD [Rhodobacterales bacterium]
MILKTLSSFFMMAAFIAFTPLGVAAQSKDPVGLFADTINYDSTLQILTAQGNVRIISGAYVLTTNAVNYNQKTGKLNIPEGFTITSTDGSILTGRTADLSTDMSQNVIRGARLLIAKQFQMAADQAQYKGNRFKVLDRVVASTCYIGRPGKVYQKSGGKYCKVRKTPFWQIRSNRVVHDELTRQLYFENARLELLGVPIFYSPRLRLPDPTVDRATGFLTPTFFTSDILNFGAKIPYFIAIDDHSDATVTAFVSTGGSFVAEGQYRRETKRGKYQFDGALLLVDGVENNPFRSTLKGSGRFRISKDYEWGFVVDAASDKTFRAQYGYEDKNNISAQDRLFSELYLERNRKDSFMKVSTSIFQSLRTNEIDAEIPLVLPDVYYRGIKQDPLLGGKLGFSGYTTTLLRAGNDRFTRFGGTLDWQRQWQLQDGLLLGARSQLDAVYYSLSDNYTGFAGTSANRVTPTVSADIRWPLSKITGTATHVIEPVAQLVWNRNTQTATPNEDSVQVEYDASNLFSTNRFPGIDKQELGFRANVGVNYTRYDPSGWNMGATAGRILRAQNLNQFSNGSGLAGENSDWVSAFTLSFPNSFQMTNRTLFSSKFQLSKNETGMAFNIRQLRTETNYIWLEKDVVAGASDRRQEATLKFVFTPSDNWQYLAKWRHDFITKSPIEGKFGVKYTNECVEINLSLSLQYAASGNVRTTKELGLTVALVGIGSQARAERRRRSCAF